MQSCVSLLLRVCACCYAVRCGAAVTDAVRDCDGRLSSDPIEKKGKEKKNKQPADRRSVIRRSIAISAHHSHSFTHSLTHAHTMRTQSAAMRAATMALLALLAVSLLATGARAADGCGDDAQSAASAEGMCTAPPEVTQHAAAPSVPTTAAAAIAASTSPTLQRVQSRGQLSCALVEFTLGHAKVDSPSVASGMEPELCKGLSAALGLGTSPYYHAMKAPGERFPLLQAGSVDVVFALTSKTAQRDMVEHGSFSQRNIQQHVRQMTGGRSE